jgi:hypothetical protein
MTKILYTSLDEIKSFNPCSYGWREILRGQNKIQADSTLFPLKDCLKSNTFSDVCWLLGKRKKEISIAVAAAKKCSESVQKYRNKYAADAAAYAADATAYATAYATDATADAAAYAYATADAYAADATADAAADAAADAYAAAYAYAYETQKQLNKQFLLEAIEEYERQV